MKTVIRKGVFETNSSSTHSLSLKKSTEKEVEKGASFEIRSKEAKITLLFGLIENAEMEYDSLFYNFDYDDSFKSLKSRIIKRIEENEPKLLNNLPTDPSLYDLSKIIFKMKDSSWLDYSFFKKGESKISNLFIQISLEKKVMLDFKEAVINEYCKLNNYTKKQALLQIDYEAFGNTYLRDILKNEETAEERLNEYLKDNDDFSDSFRCSKKSSILEFAREYLEEEYKDFKRITNGRFRCDNYFSEGCLNDCYCGFESYTCLTEQFEIDINGSKAQLQEKAKEFLSDDCRIVAKEYWNGIFLEETGEIY